jgi:hypothetical protein
MIFDGFGSYCKICGEIDEIFFNVPDNHGLIVIISIKRCCKYDMGGTPA